MNQLPNNRYNLEERTAKFGESVILFCKSINQDTINKPIINQLIRSATSVGANYMEANGASSRKDFANKIFICKKETKGKTFIILPRWQMALNGRLVFLPQISCFNNTPS